MWVEWYLLSRFIQVVLPSFLKNVLLWTKSFNNTWAVPIKELLDRNEWTFPWLFKGLLRQFPGRVSQGGSVSSVIYFYRYILILSFRKIELGVPKEPHILGKFVNEKKPQALGGVILLLKKSERSYFLWKFRGQCLVKLLFSKPSVL